MRILHVLDHSVPLHSGYTFRTLAILREQRARGWTTFQITSSKQGPRPAAEEQVEELNFYRTQPATAPWSRLPLFNHLSVVNTLTSRLDEVVRQVQPDVLHAHSPALNGLAAARIAARHGLPLVYEVRAFWEDAAVDHGTTREGSARYRLTRALESHVLRRASHITTICEGLRADIAARGLSPNRITVIPNAVDVERFSAGSSDAHALRARLGLQDTIVVGFIGSFYAYEGLDLLVDAMPILGPASPVRLLLVGGGPQESALKQRATDLGIADRITFTGRVPHEEVGRYYDAIDLLAYPRHRMRLTDLVTPLKPLEAMARRRPVAASSVGGHRELIEDGNNGLLFDADDAGALADTIRSFSSNPDLGPALAANGYEFVTRERNWPSVVARYEGVYEQAMRVRAAGAPA